mgnify:CR=1 FL=1
MKNKLKKIVLSSALLVVTAYAMSYVIQTSFATDAPASSETKPPAMSVDVAIIEEQSIRLWTEFSGRLTAVDYVEIRPQASGLITEVKFEDGQFVSKDDILYVIDPRPLKAIVAQESANLIVAQNQHALANKEYQRAKDLIKQHLISKQLYDERSNAKLVADSIVKRAQAKLSEAEINLSYAYVKAPFSCRVSRAALT